MTRFTLYAYVDGSDLNNAADELERRVFAFSAAGDWVLSPPVVVNVRAHPDSVAGDDLPDWNLGLNIELPDVGVEPCGWFVDIERIANFMGLMNAQLELDFVIGIYDTKTGISDDLFHIETPEPDIDCLRKLIGVDVSDAGR